jgi:GNAT superfamily N-acetyltransferase
LGPEALSVAFSVLNVSVDGVLIIEPFNPGAPTSPVKRAMIHDLIVQPAEPWFSEVERLHLEAALSGACAPVACDRFWLAWIDAQPVANVYFGTAAGAPEMGLLAFAITTPAQRGRGIGRLLLDEALADFVAAGGVCMHLATANPAAHHLYERGGFRDYNGHVMRYLARPEDWARFDAAYLASAGPGQIRRGHWGDAARVAMLYVAPQRWLVRDYAESLYNHPAIEQTRCASILPSLLAGGQAPTTRDLSGGLWVLENPARRLVAAATLKPHEPLPVIDFVAAPAYLAQAPELLRAVMAACRSAGAPAVCSYVAACDEEKLAILKQVGFTGEAAPVAPIEAGADRFAIYRYVSVG